MKTGPSAGMAGDTGLVYPYQKAILITIQVDGLDPLDVS
jgi:hypothetical protein